MCQFHATADVIVFQQNVGVLVVWDVDGLSSDEMSFIDTKLDLLCFMISVFVQAFVPRAVFLFWLRCI